MTADRTAATLYWRPGCPFCSRLLGELDRMGLVLNKANIWEDPAAAAKVRSVANGNETVPTVVIGSAALVNPRAADVVEVARKHAPGLLAGLDVKRVEQVAAGRWWAGLLAAVLFAAVWFVVVRPLVPPWLPACLVKRVSMRGLSGTLSVVPSIAHTKRPRHRVPGCPGVAAGPAAGRTTTAAVPPRRGGGPQPTRHWSLRA